MEEILSVIIHGCKLARDLESNLPYLSASPNDLSNSCNQIVRVFESAIHRLSSLSTAMFMINSSSSSSVPPPPPPASSSSSSYNIIPDHDRQMAVYGNTAPPEVQEWLKSSYTQAIAHQLLLTTSTSTTTTTEQQPAGGDLKMLNDELGVKMNMADSSSSPCITITTGDHGEGTTTTTTTAIIGMRRSTDTSTGGSAGEFDQMMMRPSEEQGPDSGTKSTPVMVQRSRKRKDGVDKRTVRVAGPRIGNLDVPPDDGFTWRKYGQKEILGSTFPRGYYRCTHKSFYGCEAKKQVQRLDDDPNTFEVTYYGHHTCHILSSSSSLSAAYMQQQGGTSTSTSAGGGAGSSSSFAVRDARSSREIMELQSSTSSSVVELVDAIFNSGSSNSNSMDSIFPSFPHHHHHHHHK